MDPKGTIVFVTVGIPHYGFDVFSAPVDGGGGGDETRHTDGVSSNFNAHFPPSGSSLIFVSDRSGSHDLYSASAPDRPLRLLPSSCLFRDRPSLRGDLLLFASAADSPAAPYRSWSAAYSADLRTGLSSRLTPPDHADLSPAPSPSGALLAVASYGSAPWDGAFRHLHTSIVAFPLSDPSARAVLASPGGWPCWSSDSTLLFHRLADDGWWSVFSVDVIAASGGALSPGGPPRRVTPPGVHAVTPAASPDGRWLAVATRRKGRPTRQIEIFDLEHSQFHPVTEPLNLELHHYNPFFSPDSSRVGYHRFRGERSAAGDRIVPHLRRVASPVPSLRLLRLHGTFPSVSPRGDLIALNGDFLDGPGLMVLRSDGSKRWTLIREPLVFSTAWSPTEEGVIFAAVGPIFESITKTVRIARVTFDPASLDPERDDVEVELTTLTDDAGNNAFPSCSPDGRSVVFRSGRSGHKNLYVMDASTGEAGGIRRLTEGDWTDTMPSWSPRGDLIAFSSNRHNPGSEDHFSLYVVRPDGTGLRRVYVAGPEGSGLPDRERINHVCFSPDGEWLLFTANLGAVTVEPISLPNQFQPYGDLYVCRLDGTDLRRLTVDGYENGTPAWMAGEEWPPLVDGAGDPLRGQFEEPLWLTCDI